MVNATTLQEWRAEFLDRDDVFDPAFLFKIVLCSIDSNDINVTSDAQELLATWNTQGIIYEPHLDIPNGPYLSRKVSFILFGRYMMIISWHLFRLCGQQPERNCQNAVVHRQKLKNLVLSPLYKQMRRVMATEGMESLFRQGHTRRLLGLPPPTLHLGNTSSNPVVLKFSL